MSKLVKWFKKQDMIFKSAMVVVGVCLVGIVGELIWLAVIMSKL